MTHAPSLGLRLGLRLGLGVALALALGLAFALGACSGPPADHPAAANYELDCGAANTANAAELHCVRTDTRTGEVVVVDYLKLPISTGPTAAGAAPAGRFTTSTEKRADFYCVRMNTETGELLLLNLQKVDAFPRRS
jgi:hypothetical protein